MTKPASQILELCSHIKEDISAPIPEIFNSCAHPQAVWFDVHWRPIIESQEYDLVKLLEIVESLLASRERLREALMRALGTAHGRAKLGGTIAECLEAFDKIHYEIIAPTLTVDDEALRALIGGGE